MCRAHAATHAPSCCPSTCHAPTCHRPGSPAPSLPLPPPADFTLMYQHCVGVLLKRDTDVAAKEARPLPPPPSLPPSGPAAASSSTWAAAAGPRPVYRMWPLLLAAFRQGCTSLHASGSPSLNVACSCPCLLCSKGGCKLSHGFDTPGLLHQPSLTSAQPDPGLLPSLCCPLCRR